MQAGKDFRQSPVVGDVDAKVLGPNSSRAPFIVSLYVKERDATTFLNQTLRRRIPKISEPAGYDGDSIA